MNNAVSRKAVENVRKHRNIKLKKNILVSEANYYTNNISQKIYQQQKLEKLKYF